MGIVEHQQKSKDMTAEEGCSTVLINKEPKTRNHEQVQITFMARSVCHDSDVALARPIKQLKIANPEERPGEDGSCWGQGRAVRAQCSRATFARIWQKLWSPTVPLFYVITALALIIICACLFVKAFQRTDPACLAISTGEISKTKVAKGSPAVDCVDDWVLRGRKCYYFSHQHDTWSNSQKFCKSHNSSLAIIDNEKELNFLNLLNSNNYWIGLSRTRDDSGWVWTNGTLYSETIFNIARKASASNETEHVYQNGEGFKSHSGRYSMKYICSKRFFHELERTRSLPRSCQDRYSWD